MPRVVVTHAVEDVQRWLKGKAARAAAIESGSGSNVTDYVAQDGSNKIADLRRRQRSRGNGCDAGLPVS